MVGGITAESQHLTLEGFSSKGFSTSISGRVTVLNGLPCEI